MPTRAYSVPISPQSAAKNGEAAEDPLAEALDGIYIRWVHPPKWRGGKRPPHPGAAIRSNH